MGSGMDAFLLSFKHKELERRYQLYHAEHMHGLDVRSSLMATVVYAAVLCKAHQLQPDWSNWQWCWAVLHTLLLAPAPAAWALARRKSWAQWRCLWYAAFVPYSFQLARFITRTLNLASLSPSSPYFFWNAFSYSNIGWQVVLALVYRLPFTYHLPTHVAALAVLQLQNGDWCRWAAAARPAALETIRAAVTPVSLFWSSAASSSSAGGAAPGGEWAAGAAGTEQGPDPQLQQQQQQQLACRAVLAFGQLYLGLGLGSYLVWLLERQSRHTFLLQMRAGTASVRPPPLWRKVGHGALLCAALALPVAWGIGQLVLLLGDGARGAAGSG